VHAAADERAPVVGFLHAGDDIIVHGCDPRCAVSGAWAILDGGAVRASLLRPKRADDPPSPAELIWGRVRSPVARVRVAPDPAARIIELRPAGQDLAFVPDDAFLAGGRLRRLSGGYIRTDEICSSAGPRGDGPLPYLVSPSTPLDEVVAAMAENRYGSALVVDERNRLVGIFTTVDALRATLKLCRSERQRAHS
jgi:hypothetical protein